MGKGPLFFKYWCVPKLKGILYLAIFFSTVCQHHPLSKPATYLFNLENKSKGKVTYKFRLHTPHVLTTCGTNSHCIHFGSRNHEMKRTRQSLLVWKDCLKNAPNRKISRSLQTFFSVYSKEISFIKLMIIKYCTAKPLVLKNCVHSSLYKTSVLWNVSVLGFTKVRFCCVISNSVN